MFVLLSNIFILCQINIIIWVDHLGHVKCVKFNTNFLTVYIEKQLYFSVRLSTVNKSSYLCGLTCGQGISRDVIMNSGRAPSWHSTPWGGTIESQGRSTFHEEINARGTLWARDHIPRYRTARCCTPWTLPYWQSVNPTVLHRVTIRRPTSLRGTAVSKAPWPLPQGNYILPNNENIPGTNRARHVERFTLTTIRACNVIKENCISIFFPTEIEK